MKKFLLVLLSVFMCTSIYGQAHMKFMGIPLNGTIEQFSQKLKTKGITYDAIASKKLSPGAKLYNGTFMGEHAQFVVMFNAKSRIVYGVGVELTYSTKEFARVPFLDIAEQLHKKYPTAEFSSVEKTNKTITGVNFLIPDVDSSQTLGIIMLTLDRPDGYLKKYWGINLIYMDVKTIKRTPIQIVMICNEYSFIM